MFRYYSDLLVSVLSVDEAAIFEKGEPKLKTKVKLPEESYCSGLVRYVSFNLISDCYNFSCADCQNGLYSHPNDFECYIAPRSARAVDLISDAAS